MRKNKWEGKDHIWRPRVGIWNESLASSFDLWKEVAYLSAAKKQSAIARYSWSGRIWMHVQVKDDASLHHGRKAYGSKYFLKSLHWLNLSLSWQLDKEKSWKAYISSEPGTYKCAFQVKSATGMHWFLKQSVLSRTWYALDLLLVKAVKSKFYPLLWWQSVVTVIGLLETNAASLILFFFLYSVFFFFPVQK